MHYIALYSVILTQTIMYGKFIGFYDNFLKIQINNDF